MSEENVKKTLGTKDLERVLTRKDLLSIAIGSTIGSGIFSMTGVVIGLTGRSVNLAFVISAILVIIMSIPSIFITGTVRLLGGQYTQASFLIGRRFGGFLSIANLGGNIALTMFAISFAQYLISIVPALGPYTQFIAFVFLTFFYVVNLFGIKSAAWVQNIMVVLLAAALAIFIGFGLLDVQPGYFSQPGYFTGGAWGFMVGVAYLQNATTGASNVVNYGAETKNPTKDIPFTIVVGTLIVAVIYALVGTVAAGVLPLDQVANQPLTMVAESVLPKPLMYFFVIAGAGFALSTTLNAILGFVTKPLLQATQDGWYPAVLGKVSEKHKVPWVWLTIVYAISAVCIFTGWQIDVISNMVAIIASVMGIILAYSAVRIPKVVPEQWKRSRFHCSNGVLWAGCIAAMLASGIQLVLLFSALDTYLKIGNVVFFVLAMLFAVLRDKHVNMEISYEDD